MRALAAAAAVLVLGALACATATPGARAAPGLLVGVADNAFLYDAPAVLAASSDLGLSAVRVDIRWRPGFGSHHASLDAEGLWRLQELSWWLRIVVAFYPPSPTAVPLTAPDVELFCNAAANLVADYPRVTDVIIGNEPNSPRFWRPQYDGGRSAAPGAYFRLLARCYDKLHAARPDVNVIAAATSQSGNDKPFARANAGHSPTRFVAELGKAYRASGRTRPIFDTVDHHPYPLNSAERPWRRHPDPGVVGQGDLHKLVHAYRQAFEGTAQPVPGRCAAGRCAGLWLTETGFQSRPGDAAAAAYTGSESDRRTLAAAAGWEPPVPLPSGSTAAPDQATQLRDAVELAYCQPGVQAFFNFHLADESSLRGWQSGVLHADFTRKGSFEALKAAAARVRSRTVDCERFRDVVAPLRRALR